MPEQPNMARNLAMVMLWSVVSKAADRPSSDRVTHNHCARPEVGHLLYSTRRIQCCDTSGWQVGRAPEGCETVNAAKTVLVQHTPAPLTEWQIGNRAVVFQAVNIKTGPFFFFTEVWQSMFKNTEVQYQTTRGLFMILVTMGIIYFKQSHRTGVGLESMSKDFFGFSWTSDFTKSSVRN